jgi:hypothetical protein
MAKGPGAPHETNAPCPTRVWGRRSPIPRTLIDRFPTTETPPPEGATTALRTERSFPTAWRTGQIRPIEGVWAKAWGCPR